MMAPPMSQNKDIKKAMSLSGHCLFAYLFMYCSVIVCPWIILRWAACVARRHAVRLFAGSCEIAFSLKSGFAS